MSVDTERTESNRAANTFAERLGRYLPESYIQRRSGAKGERIVLYAPPNGFGIPEAVWEGMDAYVSETVGMDGLSESHSLYRGKAHHAVIIRINGYTA